MRQVKNKDFTGFTTAAHYSNIAAVILAGGKGTRLSPLNIETPKALIELDGKSMLERGIEWVMAVTGNIFIASGGSTGIIQSASDVGPLATFVSDTDNGTGKALLEAAKSAGAEHIIVFNADTINDLDLKSVLTEHLSRGRGATIALTRQEDAQNAGAFLVAPDGQVLRSLEDLQATSRKPKLRLWSGASTGVLVIPASVLLDPQLKDAISLERDIIPHIIDTIGLFSFDNNKRLCLDIGTPERLRRMRQNERKLAAIYKKNRR